MKETKLHAEELAVIQSNSTGLSMYLSGLQTGHDFTPRSSLYNIKGKTKMLEPDAILKEWQKQLSELQTGTNHEREVFQFDSHQLEKWGPQGGVAPIRELLDEIVFPTFEKHDYPVAFKTPEWAAAKRETIKWLHSGGARGLSPVPYERVVDDMRARDTLESNSGWPDFTRRSKPEVVKRAISDARSGQWKTYPAIALFRNYNNKTRLVWMFPMSANLVEGSYFQALQSALMKGSHAKEFLAPWTGFEQVRENISQAYGLGFSIAASDFSATDAHFQLAASTEVFDCIKECFQPRYRDGLWESIEHMHQIPLVIGPDSQIEGDHGVSSGSNWTNFIETIFDRILAFYVQICEAKRLIEQKFKSASSFQAALIFAYRGMYAIGDDMSWKVPRKSYDADFSKRLEAYGESAGQEVKAEKTTNYPDKVKSLQRLFQAGYRRDDGLVRAVYPTIRALKSLVYPERRHKKKLWSKDMSAVRAFMILENCVDHPLFAEFCAFVASGDPYLKVFANKSKAHIRAAYRKSKLVPGLNPTYNQERRDKPLESFVSLQLIAKL